MLSSGVPGGGEVSFLPIIPIPSSDLMPSQTRLKLLSGNIFCKNVCLEQVLML